MYGPIVGVYIRFAVVSGIFSLSLVSDGRRCGFVETHEPIPATLQSTIGATVLLPVFQGNES